MALDAAVQCTHECIQVLGGMGYTWEHDAHLYYRRALSLRALLGPSDRWARRAARLGLAGARRAAAVDLPAGAEPLRARSAARWPPSRTGPPRTGPPRWPPGAG